MPATRTTEAGQVKHNIVLVAGWVILLLLASLLLPPLDSRVNPGPLLAKSFIVATIALSLYTVVVMFGYFNRSWRRVGLAPNRVEYATWLGFQTALFLVVFVWVLKAVVLAVAHRFGFLP
ncbi:MAG: hypothetical protein ABSG77_08935 [Candidatus Acidiferrum sp.]|jgi:hypothetical protein